MDVEFCIETVEEAIALHGRPEIFNTDQGSQFTSPRFTDLLTAAGIWVSMDGRGRWMDAGGWTMCSSKCSSNGCGDR